MGPIGGRGGGGLAGDVSSCLEGAWLVLVCVVGDEVVDGSIEVGVLRKQPKEELDLPAEQVGVRVQLLISSLECKHQVD